MSRSKPILDIQKRLMQHVKYCNDAKKWARLGIAHVKAGDMGKAQRAYEKAQAVFEKAKKIERNE
jgi:cytochrome c-type biogenesis protein CcmH/NrfG